MFDSKYLWYIQLHDGIVKFSERHRGLFDAVVSEDIFDQVQRVLKNKGKKHAQHLTDNPDFPLRRFVINEQGKKITGSWSKGRTKKYPFYRFGSKDSNYNRDRFQDNFCNHMDKYGLDENDVERLKYLVRSNLTKATLNERKEKDALARHISDLNEKQSVLIKKNLDGVINDSLLKQQLEIVENELMKATATLSGIPDREEDFESIIAFVEGYLRKPSDVWKEAKLDVQLKLQRFQFPLGLVFDGQEFGTKELACVFKTKEPFLALESPIVDPSGFEPLTSSLQKRRSTN